MTKRTFTDYISTVTTVTAAMLLALTLAYSTASAQSSTAGASAEAPVAAKPSPAAAPTPVPPLTTTAVTGPLQWASPTQLNLGKVPIISQIPIINQWTDLDINGVLSGLGMVQTHPVNGDRTARVDVSNAQIVVQKADGQFQFYLQGGAYDIPALGAATVTAGKAVNDLYGPLPVAYVKWAPTSSFSLMAGNLPTLIGAEYTFTFENIDIERGLLWNQENAINRGVQLNYAQGPITAALSWNNGFYSNSYTWMTGSLAYAINSANTISMVGGGNLGFSRVSNFATPATLNNSEILDLIYTYLNSPWIVQPYFQWTYVPHNQEIGVGQSTSTLGGAIMASYALTDDFFLAGRAEYIGSTGSGANGAANLLYGPGSSAWSLTFTPTFQYSKFFVRGEASYVHAISWASGDAFAADGRSPSQLRGLIETGFLF
ncbi:MAG TPA: outer membrane beta-barrel protein [Candidatus Binataceae bacterium]|nr:outer membrane beta-barrel protein [Candidatus Binataceae bacterium]